MNNIIIHDVYGLAIGVATGLTSSDVWSNFMLSLRLDRPVREMQKVYYDVTRIAARPHAVCKLRYVNVGLQPAETYGYFQCLIYHPYTMF